jgi:hypothetical protein
VNKLGRIVTAAVEAQESGGLSAFLDRLRDILDAKDLATLKRPAPSTRTLTRKPRPGEEWWLEKLKRGWTLSEEGGWLGEVSNSELADDFIAHTGREGFRRRGNETAMGRMLTPLCPGLRMRQVRTMVEDKPRRSRYYVMPSLERARARWEELHGPEEWE